MKHALIFIFLAAGCFAQSLPDTPSAVADRRFLIVAGADIASSTLDAVTTFTLVGHTQSCTVEVWAPELYGRKPTAMRTSLVMGSLTAASIGTAYLLKKHHAHVGRFQLWTLPMVYDGYSHAIGGIHNLRVCH